MKRMNYKRKLISNIIIWSVFISSLLLYSPERYVFSAQGVPEITIDTPVQGSEIPVSKVEFTGKISEEMKTPDKLSLKVFEHQGNSEQPVDITNDGELKTIPQEQHAVFTYAKDFTEGVHTLTFVVTDEEGVSNKIDRTFTVKLPDTAPKNDSIANVAAAENQTPSSAEEVGNRPYMEKMYFIPSGTEGQYQPGAKDEPDSYLPAEDMTRVPLDYQILIDIRSTEPLIITEPLMTFFGEIEGTVTKVATTQLTETNSSNVFLFKPKQLNPGTTYNVYLNPTIKDESNHLIIPRFLKFTTVSTAYDGYQFKDKDGNNLRELDNKDFIHGPFSNVTNACVYCHSTHNGKNPTLEGGKFGSKEDNFCMACHDGTYGAPKIADSYKNNNHNQNSSASCTSCHNPHSPGTKENPSSLKRISAKDSHFQTYKKASTAEGKAEDYSLCFSCHNGVKASNIEQFYKNETLISQSGHNIKATTDSGSPLNGSLPCAECHETHGSNNLKMLRENIGNIQGNEFITDEKDWTVSVERKFCMKCHDGKTLLYGVTGKFNDQLLEHQDSSKACSECHGQGETNKEKSLSAAHAPKKYVH